MKKNIILCAIVTVLFFILAACGAGQDDETKDNQENNDTKVENNTEKVDTEADSKDDFRVISTTVALTEIMDKLEVDLLGVPTSYKTLPERYDDAKEVGLAAEPDLELIRSLDPTDVLSVTTIENEYHIKKSFDAAGIPLTLLDLESVDGMLDSISQLGENFDRTEQAETLVDDIKTHLQEKQEQVADKESPTVLILLGIPGSYLVATENSYIGDLVRRAGGVNAIQGADAEYVQANTENLLQSKPDVILRAAHGMPDAVVKMFNKEFKENDIWKHFDAVKNERVYDLEETHFGTTANLNVNIAMDELMDMLYPEN